MGEETHESDDTYGQIWIDMRHMDRHATYGEICDTMRDMEMYQRKGW